MTADNQLTSEQLQERFDRMCNDIHDWNAQISRNVVRIATHLLAMKPLYERMTGTGWGKRRSAGRHSFDEEVARRSGVDRSLIRRYCRIGQLDPRTTSRIEGKRDLEGNLTVLYRLVQADEETRQRALDAYDKEGRPALDRALREARAAAAEIPDHIGAPLPRLRLSDDVGSDGARTVHHTFQRPASGRWLEHSIPGATVRLNVLMNGDCVAAISVQLLLEAPARRPLGRQLSRSAGSRTT
jgi:hypothetical protein